jgi:amino acid transporter
MGALFLACWATFGFETAVCYTREFKNPQRDTVRALFASGLLCLFMFIAVPIAFQGSLGLQGMLEPGIVKGSGEGAAMANSSVAARWCSTSSWCCWCWRSC